MTNQAGFTRRGFLLRSSLVTGGLIAGPALLSACEEADTGSDGGGRLDALKSAGTIKVGIAGEQPYSWVKIALAVVAVLVVVVGVALFSR